jgi:hypothetical protein
MSHIWTQAHMAILQRAFTECELCGSNDDLEFAHLNPTRVKGHGRGRRVRTNDILSHLSAYTRLCRGCHKRYDDGEITKIPRSLLSILNVTKP